MTKRSGFMGKRKQNRYQVKAGAYAVVMSVPPDLDRVKAMGSGKSDSAETLLIGQIVNIGRGGLAFRYMDSGEKETGSTVLDIMFAQDRFYLKNISFEIVNDFEERNAFSLSSIIMKQQCLKFKELNFYQIAKLDYFIKNHTTGKSYDCDVHPEEKNDVSTFFVD